MILTTLKLSHSYGYRWRMHAFAAGPLIRPQLNVKRMLLGLSCPKVVVTPLDWATHMTTAVKQHNEIEITWLTQVLFVTEPLIRLQMENARFCSWAAHTTTAKCQTIVAGPFGPQGKSHTIRLGHSYDHSCKTTQ